MKLGRAFPLSEQFLESRGLEKAIAKNPGGLGYGG